MTLYRRLFVEMAREEFRMHARLFGGRRFAAFPLFVAAVAAGATWLLTWTGTGVGAVVAGAHGLAFFFGLHTGSVGLVGRDAMRDLLGEVTMLVFSARTLPLSQRRLLGVFLVKDAAIYSAFFLLPLAVGFLAAGLGVRAAVAWGTLTATFLLGIAVTFAGIALSTRGAPGWVVLLGLAAAAGVGWVANVDLVSWTPYAVYADGSLVALARTAGATLALSAVGYAAYDTTYRRPARTAGRAFRRWHERLPFEDDGLTAKTLLDVSRSAGGWVKVAFSAGVLFGVTVGLLGVVEEITGIAPSVGLSMGSVLGLSAFTTYNWLTQSDDLSEYLLYPVSVGDVFRAKFRAFLVLGPATALAYHALGVAWLGARPRDALVGTVLLVGLSLYLFGLTVFLAGLSPNEFLFDTAKFAAFGACVAVPLVPVLIVAFVLTPVGPPLLAGLAVAAVALGGVGVGLYRRSVPRWTRYHRTR